MTRDRSQRRAYRKSPGRQYGYEYDPLRSQSRSEQSHSGRSRASTPGERLATYEDSPSRGASHFGEYDRYSGQSLQLAPRPDPRRTRQLLRQSILASKSKTGLYGEHEVAPHDQQDLIDEDRNEYEQQEDARTYGNRYPRGNRPGRAYSAASQRLIDADMEAQEGEWEELGYVDPDIGIDSLERRKRYSEALPQQSARRSPAERGGGLRHEVPDEYSEDEYADEYDRPSSRRTVRRRSVTRRKLLLGIGAVVVGGAAATVAAYELPKVPQAINDAGKNIERQLEDSFNKGFQAGGDAVRKEFITALNDLEGVTLDAAMSAAKLTRVAYDVFVSPLVKFLANITDNFLDVTLRALITGRHWLSNIGQDNNTLAALQKVLETWVQQVQQMPKQIQAVADADLDGAQAYLRALRRKIDAEQAKLNAQNTTPTTTPLPKPTPKR